MSDTPATNPDAVPWIGFHRRNRSRSVAVMAVTLPLARERTAKKMNLKLEDVDAQVVCEGETVEQAKARVAGSVG